MYGFQVPEVLIDLCVVPLLRQITCICALFLVLISQQTLLKFGTASIFNLRSVKTYAMQIMQS